MGPGVSEAARELFSSPVFLTSVCLSVAVYFGAWLVPEPLFSKAFAVTLTAALALTVGMVEVVNLALACLRLYRESEAARSARSWKQLQRTSAGRWAERLLRVLVMVASMGVAKTAPTVPPGGLGALLGPPSYAVEGGLAVEATATARVVADGSLILSGVAAGEAAAAPVRWTGPVRDGVRPPAMGLLTPAEPTSQRGHRRGPSLPRGRRDSQLRKNKAQVDADNTPRTDPQPGDWPPLPQTRCILPET